MTISELYEMFDDISDFTKINVYDAVNSHFICNKPFLVVDLAI